MIDTIFIAMSGLQGYQRGLRVIANNTANLNTPGFKGSALQFADMFYANNGYGLGSYQSGQYGFGLNTLGTTINFKPGQLQNTGNALDLAVDGQGLFVLRDSAGNIHFTRAGQFEFNADGVLVSSATGEQVMALDAQGNLTPIDLTTQRTQAATATTNVTFRGNLTTGAATSTVGSVRVYDAAGSAHTLSVRFDQVTGTPGSWTVTLLDGTTEVGSGQIAFLNGRTDPAHATVALTYAPAGQTPTTLTLDFTNNVTSSDGGTSSTLVMDTANGYPPGSLVGTAFDTAGTLVLSYSNGQKVNSSRLALGNFSSQDAVESLGNNEFAAKDGLGWLIGRPEQAGFGPVRSGMLELSNVDLSQQFSDLVIMQRGYQASSQVVSTASEMINELFGMRSK
ncbi:MAG: flagellar hook-basal body complex protein [Anaeromyxobacter sp.]